MEAAILLEQPADKVVTMILFSVIKKGAATVVTQDPLKLEISDPLPEKLHKYELDFLDAFAEDTKNKRRALQDMMVRLIKSVTTKMKGFSRKETVAYYKDIMERAWQHVEAAETPDVKMEKFDDYMGWTMLDKDFDDRTERTFRSGPLYVPMWWGRYDPLLAQPLQAQHPQPGSILRRQDQHQHRPRDPGAQPARSNFASSVVNGTQALRRAPSAT